MGGRKEKEEVAGLNRVKIGGEEGFGAEGVRMIDICFWFGAV